MNPIGGHGGNAAIEDAAMLGDLLKETLDNNPQPTDEKFRIAFSKFQRERVPRAAVLTKKGRLLQSLEALENPVLEFLNLKITCKMPLSKVIPMIVADMHTSGYFLQYLPRPSRLGRVALDQDIIASPRERPSTATVSWTLSMFLIACLNSVISRYYRSTRMTGPVNLPQVYELASIIAVNALWTIESHRMGQVFGPLCR